MKKFSVYATEDGECIMQIWHETLTKVEVKVIAEMIFGEAVFVKEES